MVRDAIAQVDSVLERGIKHYSINLPANHYARLSGWEPPIRLSKLENSYRKNPKVAAEDLPESFVCQLEICRAQAEALLVHERLGELILNVEEREGLILRALGILPNAEKQRFGEIYTCPELRPSVIARSTEKFISALKLVAHTMNYATALAYGMLILGRVRSRKQLLQYAGRIDQLFDRITRAPSVIQALEASHPAADGTGRFVETYPGFQALFEILVAVRNQLWALKPKRSGAPFLLPQVIEAYLGPQSVVGNSLGLAILDSIVLNKLGFPVHYHLKSGVLHLEVLIQNRSVYWEVTRPSPLSFVPIAPARMLKTEELFALADNSLATLYFKGGRLKESINLYKKVLELTPASSETYNSLAACYIRMQMPKCAVKVIKHAFELELGGAEAYHNLGNAYAQMKSWPRAIQAFKKAIALKPDYVEAYNNLGFAFYRSGRAEQAIATFEAAIEIKPAYIQAHFNLGTVYLETGQYDEAVKFYRNVVRLSRKSSDTTTLAHAYYNTGQAQYRKGRLDAAIASYRKAVQTNPKHYGAWHNLGIAYRDKGLKNKAVEALEKAVTINPNLMR